MSVKDNSNTLSQDPGFPIAFGWLVTATAVSIASWAGLYIESTVL
jgi:hypothetical protein